jgi:hypothetical protein
MAEEFTRQLGAKSSKKERRLERGVLNGGPVIIVRIDLRAPSDVQPEIVVAAAQVKEAVVIACEGLCVVPERALGRGRRWARADRRKHHGRWIERPCHGHGADRF